MPSDQVYVLEFIVNRIELMPNVTISNIQNISVNFKFAQYVNFDVETSNFDPPEFLENSNDLLIRMGFGKTFLFVAKPSKLRSLFYTEPYQITLIDNEDNIGSCEVEWKREFSDMIKFFETLGIVKSTTVEDIYDLRDSNGLLTAKIEIFLRLGCFGSNVQTMFQIKKDGPRQEYRFRQKFASRTFKVEKYFDDRCQPLVAPLYSAITEAAKTSQVNIRENVSLTAVYERGRAAEPKASEYATGEEEGGAYPGPSILLDFDNADAVSICYRPSENKFFNLLSLVGPDVQADVQAKGSRTEVILQKRKTGVNFKKQQYEEDDDDELMMTADIIAKKLCGNKDCPAVKKFGEYGIGPLATGEGLGTVYDDIQPPVTYGMTHAYGTMCEYGPYGTFSRPKHEVYPFIPLEPPPKDIRPCNMPKNRKKKKSKCPYCPKRLRGGTDYLIAGQTESEDGKFLPKSPIVECKGIMDKFDQILNEYRRAIGPCGQPTCPYAPTMGERLCRMECGESRPKEEPDGCKTVPCDNKGCPYEEQTTKRYPAGCGSPKCAYAQYKIGLVDADAELELKFLPPALQDSCGHPTCPYPLQPTLPPIHWDCPDPLPKGPCRNLNCPFQPSRLKKFKTSKELKTGPCGSPLCPYALPQPCGNPTCPFGIINCPMKQPTKDKRDKDCPCAEEDEDDDNCENPECPFSSKTDEVENDLNDDQFQGEFQDCANPECPFKKKSKDKKKKRKKDKGPKESACGNPECPAVASDKNTKKRKQDSEETSMCSNPDCPAKGSSNSSKSITEDSVCSDPFCIYAATKKDKRTKSRGSEIVQKQTENLCTVPGCPYSQPAKDGACDDPQCPYVQPLPSCGVPNCPYEPIPIQSPCTNEQCPSRSVDFNKDRRSGSRRSSAVEKEDKTMDLKTTNACDDDVVCELDESCDNPDCDAKTDLASKTKYESKNEAINEDNIIETRNEKVQRKKYRQGSKAKGKFVYCMGDIYPGTKLGHRECVTPIFNVPANMGWLWNIFTPVMGLKPRRGWRPGALTKTIAARIRAHRQSKGLGYLRVPVFRQDGSAPEDANEVKVVPKPTLHIQKKEGTYWITMNPLKDPHSLVENEDPYMECTPMTFKVTKNKKQHDDYCTCDGEEVADNMSTSSDSELDIEFTPPAGVIHPERFKKRPNVVCCESQYDPQDFEEPKKEKASKGKGKGKGKGKDKKGKDKKGKEKKGKGGKKGKKK